MKHVVTTILSSFFSIVTHISFRIAYGRPSHRKPRRVQEIQQYPGGVRGVNGQVHPMNTIKKMHVLRLQLSGLSYAWLVVELSTGKV